MENAKRMVLIDEKLLDYKPMLQHFQSKQDLSWKRPTEQLVKSTISKQLKSTLDDPAIPEDVKAKRYTHNLSRFLHTKRKLVEEEHLVDLMPTVDELLDIKAPAPPEESQKKKKKRKRRKKTPEQTRVSERLKKKPQRFADTEWLKW
jgi:hypothetical protein